MHKNRKCQSLIKRYKRSALMKGFDFPEAISIETRYAGGRSTRPYSKKPTQEKPQIPQTIFRNNQIVKITNCLCPDGKRRTAVLGQPDTWYSINARVQAFGKTVTGYVTERETDTEERDYEFIPYLYRKNHAAILSKKD